MYDEFGNWIGLDGGGGYTGGDTSSDYPAPVEPAPVEPTPTPEPSPPPSDTQPDPWSNNPAPTPNPTPSPTPTPGPVQPPGTTTPPTTGTGGTGTAGTGNTVTDYLKKIFGGTTGTGTGSSGSGLFDWLGNNAGGLLGGALLGYGLTKLLGGSSSSSGGVSIPGGYVTGVSAGRAADVKPLQSPGLNAAFYNPAMGLPAPMTNQQVMPLAPPSEYPMLQHGAHNISLNDIRDMSLPGPR